MTKFTFTYFSSCCSIISTLAKDLQAMRVIRLKKNKKGKVPNIVDNEVGSHDICNLFKNKYKSLYSSVPYDEACRGSY